MKTEEIQQMFGQYEQAVCVVNGVECWSARELCRLLGYTQWRNFASVIEKAKASCENAGQPLADLFADVSKTILLRRLATEEKKAIGTCKKKKAK